MLGRVFFVLVLAHLGASPALWAATTVVRIGNTNVLPGATLKLPIGVNATGAENAIGFSILFDPAKFTFVSVGKLPAMGNATLNMNSNFVASGRVGLAFALPIGTALPAGTHDVLLLTFEAAAGTSGTTSLGFGDSPIFREVAGVAANSLPSSFTPGQITLGPPPVVGPTLNIAKSGDSAVLFWLASETGFELFASDTIPGSWTKVTAAPIEIGGQKIVTVPRTGTKRYFQLKKP